MTTVFIGEGSAKVIKVLCALPLIRNDNGLLALNQVDNEMELFALLQEIVKGCRDLIGNFHTSGL